MRDSAVRHWICGVCTGVPDDLTPVGRRARTSPVKCYSSSTPTFAARDAANETRATDVRQQHSGRAASAREIAIALGKLPLLRAIGLYVPSPACALQESSPRFVLTTRAHTAHRRASGSPSINPLTVCSRLTQLLGLTIITADALLAAP